MKAVKEIPMVTYCEKKCGVKWNYLIYANYFLTIFYLDFYTG